MSIKRSLFFASVIAVGGILIFASDQMLTSSQPEDFPAADAEGVWQSRGYGWVWVVDDGDIRAYDHTGTFCIEQSPDAVKDSAIQKIRLDNGAQSFRVAIDDPSYLVTFDKISALPERCTDKPASDPAAVYQAAIELFSKHYAFFSERNIDWPAQAAQYADRINAHMADDELFTTLSQLVAPIDDAHVSLEGNSQSFEPPTRARPVPALAQDRQDKIGYWTRGIGPDLIDGRVRSAGDKQVRYGLIGDDVGYMQVGSTGSDLNEAVESGLGEARKLFKGAKALIIDLTGNGGGLDSVARKFASLFTKERVVGYYKFAGDAKGEEPQAIYVGTGDTPLYTGPIYLITDHETVSAAEILVMCLRALPNVMHVGEATRGSLSDILDKDLPNGWSLTLSNEIYLDSERKAWEGKGIPPHIEFTVHDKKSAPGDPDEAALGLINFLLNEYQKS